MKQWNELMEERGTRKDKPMKPQVVTYHLNKLLDKDAIVTSDCGTVTTWTARYIQMRDDMKFSASGMLATMGNGLPYSVGAAVAYPGRQVVAVCGDGGFTMMMMEVATLVKYKLPVKVIIIKNNVLGQIKWEQMVMEGNPQFGVQLQPIDFAMYAKACGAAGLHPGRSRAGRVCPARSAGSAGTRGGGVRGRCQRAADARPRHHEASLRLCRGPRARAARPLGHHQDRIERQDPRGRVGEAMSCGLKRAVEWDR